MYVALVPRTSSPFVMFMNRLLRAPANYPKARYAGDFRRLYDNASEFDAAVESTPEHTHAFATLPALKLGKHVYCEKPLSYNIWEARVIRKAAARAKVATPMGTQIHASLDSHGRGYG
jgi:predicted dehydrogenase